MRPGRKSPDDPEEQAARRKLQERSVTTTVPAPVEQAKKGKATYRGKTL